METNRHGTGGRQDSVQNTLVMANNLDANLDTEGSFLDVHVPR